MVKLCVFDMDGLLLDSERTLYLNNALEVSKNINYPIEEEFLCSLMGAGWDDYRRRLVAHMPDSFPIEEYLRQLWLRINDIIENGKIPLRKGVKDILDYCLNNSIKMAVATSTHHDVALKCLKNAGIYDYFDYVITGDMVEKSKPDPEIFNKAIDHYGISKEDVLIFEDGHNGALAALGTGARLVLVEDLAYVDDKDRKQAYLCLKDISDAIEYIRRENETASSL